MLPLRHGGTKKKEIKNKYNKNSCLSGKKREATKKMAAINKEIS